MSAVRLRWRADSGNPSGGQIRTEVTRGILWAAMATSDAILGTFCVSFGISPESLHSGIGAAGRRVRSLRVLGIPALSARRPAGRMGRSR